jgi:D-lactate dehydrogenase (cytochrome)
MTTPDPATPAARTGDVPLAVLELRDLLASRVSTRSADLEQHGQDESAMAPALPDAVVFAQSTDEVAGVVRICAAHGVPVIAFGAGSSLEGHVLATHGGVALDLTTMHEVLEINAADLDCRVQAGVTLSQLDTTLKGTGLFFPVDPGADATLGGMTATGASGTNAVRYGTMRHNVLGMTIVLPDGRVVRTGTRARKSSAGYDLTRLFVGSEGTLGIITEVQLRLYGVPETIAAAVCHFDDLRGAVQTVVETIQFGIPVARIELLDERTMEAVIAHSGLEDLAVSPTLFLEFHGSPRAVEEQADQVAELAAGNGGGTFRRATAAEDRNRLWAARHNALYACLAIRPGSKGISTDVCVPISRLAECLLATREDIDASGIIAPLVGHAGDGNFHALLLVDPDDPEELARAEAVNERMVHRALAMGGTCSGEHGIGLGKRSFLQREHGDAVDVMRTVKRALDPANIMNPGKVV